jgi:plastocyanin
VLKLLRASAIGALALALAGCAGAASLVPSAAPSVGVPSAQPSAAASSAAPAASSAASAGTSPAAGSGDAVTIANFAFDPSSLSVKTGAAITWTNNDGTAHTVTFDDGSDSSQHLQKGQTFERTFAKAGTFAYHCSIHPSMTGTVTVTG